MLSVAKHAKHNQSHFPGPTVACAMAHWDNSRHVSLNYQHYLLFPTGWSEGKGEEHQHPLDCITNVIDRLILAGKACHCILICKVSTNSENIICWGEQDEENKLMKESFSAWFSFKFHPLCASSLCLSFFPALQSAATPSTPASWFSINMEVKHLLWSHSTIKECILLIKTEL